MPLFVPYFAETASATITIDGVTYRVPLIDSDGHLQVDVLTSALPSGAATLAEQQTQTTALQLIDDLRAALDSVQTDRLNVNAYADGASEVKSILKRTADDSTTRRTAITPTSGKKIRVISVQTTAQSTTGTVLETYFGTGATYLIDVSKIIASFWNDVTDAPTHFVAWPDGGGPIGAADEVLSTRTTVNITTTGYFTIHYREE